MSANKGGHIDPAVDHGRWYDIKAKRRKLSAPSSSPPAAPESGWKTFPGCVPKMFNEGHIFHHLVESLHSPVTDDSDTDSHDESIVLDSHTSKPLRRGKQFFNSGHVTHMMDTTVDNCYYVKAVVLASIKQASYETRVTLSGNSGFVLAASCQCKSSALGRCSHVGAVLVAINDSLLNYVGDTACTSKACEWNVGKKNGKTPSKITEVCYNDKRTVGRVMQFDSRPPAMRSNEIDKYSLSNFITSLQSINPNSQSMWQTLLFIEYDDFELSPSHREVIQGQVTQLLENVTPAASGPVLITGSQGTSVWANERRVRVTASNAKNVCVCATEHRLQTLVNDQLWGERVQTATMLYGTKHEALARDTFDIQIQSEIVGFQVAETGMWVNRRYPGIGASPDGVLYDPLTCSEGVLEIKCPHSLQTVDPNKFDELLTGKRLAAFYLKRDDTVTLKKTHQYYYQIQLQMAVCEMQWGYFVVWTPCGLFYEKITYDSTLIAHMIPKLTDYHREHLCPEYFLMRLPRRLPLLKLTT